MKILKNINNYLFFAGAIAILILLGASFWFLIKTNKSSDQVYRFTRVAIGEKKYHLEIADSNVEREKGLGGRESLCKECGMLFVFEKHGQYAFWMKDMRFSLDIIWLSGDEVVFVAHDVSPDFSGVIESGIFADRVIEVNAGAANNIKEGERVKFLR